MEITNKYHKYDTIRKWKGRGLIHDNIDELYEEYINTFNCQHCAKPFKNTQDRHLDHDHDTGLFRLIVCHKCNAYDNYIKYPDGYDRKEYDKKYYENHKEEIIEYHKEYYEENKKNILEHMREKIKCICGTVSRRGDLPKHKRTTKHMKLMDIYMNNID
jgi:hypothetical protein